MTDVALDLGSIDFGNLKTDQDFDREADRLVPEGLLQAGRAKAESAWQQLSSGLGFLGQSLSREDFVDQVVEQFLNEAGESGKAEMKRAILQWLRAKKKDADAQTH